MTTRPQLSVPYQILHLRDKTSDDGYSRTVYAHPCPEGWEGWHYREHAHTMPITTWLKEVWEEVDE